MELKTTANRQMRPVARRHYIETGVLRHFDVRYCSVAELPGVAEEVQSSADGQIIVPLCETVNDREAAILFAYSDNMAKRANWLVAVPPALSNLAACRNKHVLKCTCCFCWPIRMLFACERIISTGC